MTWQQRDEEVYGRGISGLQGKRWLLTAIALVLVAFFVVSSSVRIVDVGTVGIVKRLGRVTGTILDPGMHFVMPFVDTVITYNTKDIIYEVASPEKQATSHADYLDYPLETTTQDGQQITMSFTVRFRINREETVRIAQTLGDESDAVEKVVKFHSRIVARQVPRTYPASELYTGNVTLAQQEIEDQLRPMFAAKGLDLDAFGIREIVFSQEYISAIEQKQIERERVITEQHRAEQAKFRKEATITEAEGEAEAIRLRGEALRENPDIVQLEFVNAIRDPDSSVRLIVVPSESVLPILNLSDVASVDIQAPSTPKEPE